MKKSDLSHNVTIISQGVKVEGKIIAEGDIRIDGEVDGDISANGNITIGEHGIINGEISAEVISLGGKVYGTISAKEKLVLESRSILKGDLITKILVIEAGAKFDGSSQMTSKENHLKTNQSNLAQINV